MARKPIEIKPEWSHALAIIAQSPAWNGRQQAKDAFMDEAERYGSYDALPSRLKKIYQNAYQRLTGRKHERRERAPTR